MKNRGQDGFTLIEILVAVTILSIVMSILYGTFNASSVNARVVEEKADEVSSITGALDIISRETRGAYPASDNAADGFSGRKEGFTFTTMTPFVKTGEPFVQRISYLFEDGRLIRKTFSADGNTEATGEFLLLDNIKEPSFSFFSGNEWVSEWTEAHRLPSGVKVVFTYKGKKLENVMPIWSGR